MKLGIKLYRGTIAVDIDGVIADFEGKFCEDFGDQNRHLYSLEARYPELDPQLINEYVANPENYRDLAPIFGGILFCHQAHQRGWFVLLVTSRNVALRDVTKMWLDRYGVVYDDLLFAKNKMEALEDYNFINPSRKVQIVVDDSEAVLESMEDKYYCVAWSQPWNLTWYPRIWYSGEYMKLCMYDAWVGNVVGVWDKVKNEKS